jgi:uncharacterized protein
METKPLVKWGWLRALIFIPVLILCLALIMGGLSFLFKNAGIKFESTIIENSISEFIQILGLFLAIYICRRFIDRQDMPSLGLNFNGKDFLMGCLLGIVLMSVGCVAMAMAGWSDFEYQGFDPKGLMLYLVMFVLVAILEECMLRTYLLHNLMQSMNKYVALVITSAIFSILHAWNPSADLLSSIEIFLAGLLLGLWYIHRGNIWFPIGLHLTWNYFQGPIWGHEVSGNAIKESLLKQIDMAETVLSGGKFGLEGSAIGIVVTILGGLWIEWYVRKNQVLKA